MNRSTTRATEVATTAFLHRIKAIVDSIRNRTTIIYACMLCVLATLSTASPAAAAPIFPGGQCIPTNDTLSAPLAPFLGELVGALGGLLFTLVVVMLVGLTVAAVITITTNKAPRLIQAMAKLAVLPFALMAILGLYGGALTLFNGLCG